MWKKIAMAALLVGAGAFLAWRTVGLRFRKVNADSPVPLVFRPTIAPSTASTQAAASSPSRTQTVGARVSTPTFSTNNPFSVFSEWMDRFAGAPVGEREGLIAEGRTLARQRAEALAELIQQDPEAALQTALSYAQRQALPEQLAALVEQPLNAMGDYEVIASMPLGETDSSVPAIRRGLRLQGHLYEASTYGAGLAWPSQVGLAVNGIVLPSGAAPSVSLSPYPTGKATGLVALSPNPVRVLDTSEASDYLKRLRAEPICGDSGLPVNTLGTATVSQVGGIYHAYCCQSHQQAAADARTANIEAVGTDPSAPTTDLPTTATGTGTAPTTWTKGNGKRYIFCRPIFSDYSGYTSDAAVFSAYVGYSNYMVHTSYGQLVPAAIGTNLAEGSYVTPPLLLPGVVADYAPGGTRDITQDIIKAAHSEGINFKAYSFFAIVHADKPGFNAAGVATVGPSMNTDGGSQAWCRLMGSRTSLDSSLLGHELGHNLHLIHSHGWNTSGQSVIGPGAHDEYGDPDSLMGATWGRDSYTANLRYYLGWLSGAGVQTITGSGVTVATLTVLDDHTNGVRAIRIKHPKYSQYYWLEYRSGRSWMDATEAANSIGLRWGSPNGSEAWWLNVAPDRLGNSRFAAGHTFTDPYGNLYITPLGPSTNAPDGMDVAIAIGPFDGNLPPVASISANRLSLLVGGRSTFTVTASDPNGDSLAYGWDFGGSGKDAPAGLNTNRVTHVFSTPGDYEVRCTVSDLRGGRTTESLHVHVGATTGYSLSGMVVATDGSPESGVRVGVDDSHFDFTDSNGHYTLYDLAAGSYSVMASDTLTGGLQFESWLPNPVGISNNVVGVNFTILSGPSSGTWRTELFSDTGLKVPQLVTRSATVGGPLLAKSGAKSARWSGLFYAPMAGNYLVHATGNGALDLSLNGSHFNGTLTNGTNQEVTGFISLEGQQSCAVRIEFIATDANPSMNLQWTPPGADRSQFTPEQILPTTGGLRGTYFADTSLTNLAFTRVDPTVNFPSGVTPGPRLPGDHFSVRWRGTVRSRNGGNYQFKTVSDDGVRLRVNGKVLIDNWTDHGATEDTGTIRLSANTDYELVLEYYQGAGAAEMVLFWIPPGGTREVIPASQLSPASSGLWADYYQGNSLGGLPLLSQIDPLVDFELSNAAPQPGVPANQYSARWQGILSAPVSGGYQVSVWADDSMRLWVNGNKVLDNWGFQGSQQLSAAVNLDSNSPVSLRLEMQQVNGNSGAQLSWTPPGGTNVVIPSEVLRPVRSGLWAEFYNRPDIAEVADASVLRSVLSEDYRMNGLPQGITTNAFSARWHGRLSAAVTGLHHLILTSAGRARLWVDGALAIDAWALHGKTDALYATSLIAGEWHDIQVDYQNLDGGGALQLSWTAPGIQRQSVPSPYLAPPIPHTAIPTTELVQANGQWQLRWPAALGPLSAVAASDLRTAVSNWASVPFSPVLSNGLWYLHVEGSGEQRFFRLLPTR